MSLEYFNKFSSHKEDKTTNNEVWIYTRVSSKKQLEGYSLDNQLQSSKSYAKSNGYKITNTFGGTYESAKGDFTRKEFKKLIDTVKKSRTKPFAILIYKMARFSRTGGNAVGLVNELVQDTGVHLIEVVSGKDTTSDRGENEILKSLLEARQEQIERMEYTMPGLIKFIEAGNWLGNTPRGYDHYGKKVTNQKFVEGKQRIVINEDGEKLKKAWKWKHQETPDFKIKEKLSALGLDVSKQFLSAMWRNPFYCGISTHSFLKGKAIKGNWEAIVSVKGFQIITERLNTKANNGYKQSKYHNERPLQQFMICGECGTKYTGYKAKKQYDTYKCGNTQCKSKDLNAVTSTKSKGVNELFVNYLTLFELSPTMANVFKEQMKLTINELEKDSFDNKNILEKRKKGVLENLKKLERKNIVDDLDSTVYHQFKTEFNDELNQINDELHKTRKSISNLDNKINSCIEITQNISKSWTSGDIETKHKLQQLVFPQGIVINPKNREYRTEIVNQIFVRTSTIAKGTKRQKKDPSVKLTDESLVVAGTRLELMTSGL